MKRLLPVLLSFFLLFLSCTYVAAQRLPPHIRWQHTYGGTHGEKAYGLTSGDNNTLVMAGYTYSNNGDVGSFHGSTIYSDAWVVAAEDVDGTIYWERTYGGSKDDVFMKIYNTSDGYIAVGNTVSNDGDVSGNHGGYDIWVVKLDRSGNISWQKCLGGTGTDIGADIKKTADGGYIVTGSTFSTDGDVISNHGGQDILVVKLDKSGNKLWSKTYGGSYGELPYAIQQTTDGGYVVAGFTNSADGDVSGAHSPGGSSYTDGWLLKLDNTGAISWQRPLGGSRDDVLHAVIQTKEGGYMVAGWTGSNNGDVSGNHDTTAEDAWMVKLKADGSIDWQKCYGGSGLDAFNSIQQLEDSDYVATGNTRSIDGDVSGLHGVLLVEDYWALRANKKGAMQWQKCLGGSYVDEAYSILTTADSGYAIAGYTQSNDGDVSGFRDSSNTNVSLNDFWLVRLSNDSVSTDVPLLNNAAVQVYPTLTTGVVHVELPAGGKYKIEVFNEMGQAITAGSYESLSQRTLMLGTLPPGNYFLKITGQQHTYNYRLTKL